MSFARKNLLAAPDLAAVPVAEKAIEQITWEVSSQTPISNPLIDRLAVEEPLEIRVVFGPGPEPRSSTSLSITMRSPGHDFELAVGFLVSESIIRSSGDVLDIQFCGPPVAERLTSNIVKVHLASHVPFDLQKLQRHFYTTSSCGICGKASLEAVQNDGMVSVGSPTPLIDATVIGGLPDRLRRAQPVFASTGGLHAAGFFRSDGDIVCVREDVGRHNAVDKVVGHAVMGDGLPLTDCVLVVSGRASFELVQKAIAAGFSMLVAVGAPSNLAVELAQRFDVSLIGFTRANRFNVYSCPQRVMFDKSA